jgi:peptide/nickel transport system permease protein
VSPRYVLRRLAQIPPVILGIVLVGFLLLYFAPGDPILAIAGADGNAAFYDSMRRRFGLDQPLPAQLATYLRAVLHGDLGTSIAQGRSVGSLIGERLPATLLLTTSALVLSSVVGTAIGVFTARRQRRPADTATTVVMLTVYAAPVFWIGQLALLTFALRLGLFPVQGMVSPRSDATGLLRLLDIAHHLVLPVAVLAAQQVAVVARLVRAGLIEELRLPHIRTARSKGLSERRVVRVHALRRALLPAVTVVGSRIGHLFTGTVIVEIVFGWPGIGRLLLTAIQTRDNPVLLGLFLLIAVTVVVANLLTDLVYGLLDPRIRLG